MYTLSPDTPLIWQEHCPAPPPLYATATQQSLTQALSDLGAAFSVQLRYLGTRPSSPYFADVLPHAPELFVREVCLFLNHTPVVWAQSACLPHSAWREKLHCGNTPLGALLFSGQLPLQRSNLQFTLMPKPYLFARRSWFDWHADRLFLVECFLPEIRAFLP